MVPRLLLLSLVATCLVGWSVALPSNGKSHKTKCKTDQDCAKTCAPKHTSSGHCDPVKKHCACDKAGGKHTSKSPVAPKQTQLQPHNKTVEAANAGNVSAQPEVAPESRDAHNASLAAAVTVSSESPVPSPGPDSLAPAPAADSSSPADAAGATSSNPSGSDTSASPPSDPPAAPADSPPVVPA